MSMAIEAWIEGVIDKAGFEHAGRIIDELNKNRDDENILNNQS